MGLHRLTVKQILSRVRELFPDIQETYGMSLINDAVVELGKYNVKYSSAKTSSVSDQMWYTLSDADSGINVNKVFKVSFMDNAGDYKKIPRLIYNETEIEDLI